MSSRELFQSEKNVKNGKTVIIILIPAGKFFFSFYGSYLRKYFLIICRILLECTNNKARLFNFSFSFRDGHENSEECFQIPLQMTFWFSKKNIFTYHYNFITTLNS